MSVRVEKGIRPKHPSRETRQEENVQKQSKQASTHPTRRRTDLPPVPRASYLHSFQIRLLLPVPFRTLPFPLAVFVPQKTRVVADHRRLKIQRTREQVGLAARSTEAPFGIKGRRGWQERVGDEPGRQGRNGGFDVVVAVVRLSVGVGVVHRRMGPRERIGRSLGAGAENRTRAGRRWW